MHKPHIPATTLALLLLLTAMACHAGEEPADELVVAASTTTRPGWTRLVYKGEAIPGNPVMTLELSESSMEAMTRAVPKFSTGTSGYFTADSVRLLNLSVQGTEARSRLRIWFDAATGTVLQRDRLKSGPEGSRKTHRFGPNGAARVRLHPANSAQGQATPATWTLRKDKVYHYDLDAAGCRRVTVPGLLLYDVTASARDTAETYLCVFQDDALFRVWLEPRGTEPATVDYSVTTGKDSRRIQGERQLEKVALRVEPVTPGADVSKFELLELRGDIAIYIDRSTGLPVGISGDRSVFSDIRIWLSAATVSE